MTKTLADMTAEERTDCVGMWAQIPGNQLVIIVDTGSTHMSWLVFPHIAGERRVYENKSVTPQYDLPRAWTPDGEPVEMVREYGNGGWDEESDTPYHWPIDSAVCKGRCSPFDKTPAEYSRWVSKWEPIKPEPRRVNGMVNEYV